MRLFVLFILAALILAEGVVRAQTNLPLLGVGGHAGASFVGDLDTAPSGIAGWWGFEASKSADRGTAAIRVCQPGGSTCANVATDATTGEITSATIATAGMSTCNNSSNICTVGVVGAPGQVGLYDKSGNGNNITPPSANGTLVIPPSCPFGSTVYCMQATTSTSFVLATGVATVCPINIMSVIEDTTNGAAGPNILIIPDAGTGISLDDQSSSRADYYNSGFQTFSGIATGSPYVYFGGSGSSGFFNVAPGGTQAATNAGTCGSSHVASVSIVGAGFAGYWFKAAYWNGSGASLPVSQATAATIATNTRARLGF